MKMTREGLKRIVEHNKGQRVDCGTLNEILDDVTDSYDRQILDLQSRIIQLEDEITSTNAQQS
jgi:Mg2+ and Co2+ transporter CorA